MRFDLDTWLGGLFGCEVFRGSLDKDETLEPGSVFSEGLLPRRAFYYAKVPVTSVAQVGALTTAGFRVIDVNVAFERQPQDISSNETIIIRDVKPEDETDVLKIAESSFIYSRFHLDPQVSKELADKIKREWIANYIRKQRGERLLVAEINGKPVGFLAILVTNEKIGVIDLIGVDKNMQAQGIGKRLVQFHINDAAGKYSRLLVGTQIANIPSMRLYQTCGYKISNSTFVLHAHVNEGKVI
ncbi:MAG: GNAT family N-acetyltransferase [Anaerolineales bacterium]|nr:MAG: GNAT family N-acetyltransferase [Anaerolineales bacterium]